MNTNMTGLRWFYKNRRVSALWMKVASALEGLTITYLHFVFLRFRQDDVPLKVSFSSIFHFLGIQSHLIDVVSIILLEKENHNLFAAL